MTVSLSRIFRKAGTLLIPMMIGGGLSAQTVPVTIHLSFERADSASIQTDGPGDALIFVLDHSGSMSREDAVDPTTGTRRSRWDALLASLKVTLGQIEPGSIVQVIKVGETSETKKVRYRPSLETVGAVLATGKDGVLVRGEADIAHIYQNVEQWGSPSGGTPLYHGLYLACQEAQRFLRAENRNVCIVVFSDGKDEDHTNPIRRKEDLKPFKNLFDEPCFNALLSWVGVATASPDPPFGLKYPWRLPGKNNRIPVVCQVRPRPLVMSLKNPNAAGSASVSAAYKFSLSQERWNSLLAEGMDVDIGFNTPEGRAVDGDVVHIRKGTTSADVVFRVPDSFFASGKAAMFDLTLSLPDGVQACRFIPPPPIRLSFEEQGSVTLSSVKPDSGTIAKVGETVAFSASGTDGASFAWTFGDGSSAQGANVFHAFTAPAPEGVSFSVTASKQGLSPATKSGSVVVVEAGVKLDPFPKNLKVGDTALFSCRGQGEVVSYDWFVDGAPAIGEDAKDGGSSRISVPLSKVGDHTIRVRANMKRVFAETPDIAFSVMPAPFAAIVKPEPNERFAAETVVPLEASVEGGFSSGVWTVRDASGAIVGDSIQSAVVSSSAKANFPSPESGGDFIVSFVAGEGSDAVSAVPVSFSVKAKNVRIDVVSPVKDAPVRTGAAFDLKAATAGLSGSVEFFLVNESSGAETRIADAKIAVDGSASVSHVFPVTDGQGERMLVAKTVDGKVVSDPVSFVLVTDAGLVLKAPANNAQVEYDRSLPFEAEPTGVVSSKDVQWFLRPIGGIQEQIKDGTGAKYEHVFSPVPNRKAISYEVYACALLPDGSSLETDHVIVRASCPDLSPVILLPETNGVMRSSFGRRENIDMQVRVCDGLEKFVQSVKWDFGDATIPEEGTRTTTRHAYENYAQDVCVRATVVCSRCGDEHVAERVLTVEAQPPLASFVIAPDKNTFSIRSRLTLRDTSAGDVDRCVWMTNSEVFATCERGGSIELSLPRHPCEMTIGMRAENSLGASSEAQPRTVRVRYGGWLIGAFVFIAALILLPFVKLLTGNGPAGWRIATWRGPVPKPGAKGEEAERRAWTANRDFDRPIPRWSLKDKRASIPPADLGLNLEDMGGLPPKDGNLVVSPIDPKAGGLLALVPDITADRALLGEPGVEYYRWFSSSDIRQRDMRRGRPLRCLRVVLDTNHRAYRYVVALWILAAALLAVVIWASFEFAI